MSVSVNILGSTTFNSFDISIRWNRALANTSSVDLTGTILPGPLTTTECIDGSGTGCNVHDGPGVVHIAATGGNTTAPASGRLFRIPFLFFGGSVRLSVGFQTGCPTTSVANTDVCVRVATGPSSNPGMTPVPEAIQSQLLGSQLPTSLASSGGLVNGTITQGGAPNFADTYVTPYAVTLPGNITTWKVQFNGGLLLTGIGVPAGIQLKVFRKISPTSLIVVGAGPVHDPRPVLESRLPSYPFFLTESSVMAFYSDPGIAVEPGDLVGLTIMSNSTVGGYFYPLVNGTGTRVVLRNVPLNGTINLADNSTGTLPLVPAVQVFIKVPPPSLDTSGGGIPDFVALSPEMRALNVDPCRKTVLVQIDYMVSNTVTHKPFQAALDNVTTAFDNAPVPATIPCPYTGFPFKSNGIKLVFDVRNAIPQQDVLNFTHSEPQSFDTIKAAFLDPNRVDYFHYGLFANHIFPEGTPQTTVSGISELFGPDFEVSLGGWTNGVGTVNEQGGTLMHELGHNLGLDHGGDNSVNNKPNYRSVMDYAFQVIGITSEAPDRTNTTRLDYSNETLGPLDETMLDESAGLSDSNGLTRWVCPDHTHIIIGRVRAPIDWNCNGQTDPGTVSSDINNDTSLENLTGFNDWARLQYKFTESSDFRVGCRGGCGIGDTLTYPQVLVLEAQWSKTVPTPTRSTSTSVSCNPSAIPTNTPTNCTVTVTDTGTGASVTPGGTVNFGSGLGGTFQPSDSCALTGSGASSTCSVTYTPAPGSPSSQTIFAYYSGDILHIGSNGSTGISPARLTSSEFFTDPNTNSLPMDQTGNPKVDVVLAGGVVRSTNPGEIIAWVNVTNTSGMPVQSLKVNDSLPVDWIVAPVWLPGKGAIHVFYANTTSLSTNPEITDPKTITLTLGNPQSVSLAIPNLNATLIGHPLLVGQSILLAVKLDYGLDGTTQSFSSFPRPYTDTSTVTVWTGTSFTGTAKSATSSASFTARAKLLGDANGDNRVDIVDVALTAYAYGSKPGVSRWNASTDFDNDGIIDIRDMAIAAFYYGTSA